MCRALIEYERTERGDISRLKKDQDMGSSEFDWILAVQKMHTKCLAI